MGATPVSTVDQDPGHTTASSLEDESSNQIFNVDPTVLNKCAIIDCGASESIIGAHTLQHVCDHYSALGLDPRKELTIDRTVTRNFLFGNNQTSASLGLASLTAGIHGTEQKLPLHIVEGPTPMLLSSQWLEQEEAVINFKTGQACFKSTGDRQIQLQRSPTRHWTLPIDGFGGHDAVNQLTHVPDADRCPKVDSMREPHDGGGNRLSTQDS